MSTSGTTLDFLPNAATHMPKGMFYSHGGKARNHISSMAGRYGDEPLFGGYVNSLIHQVADRKEHRYVGNKYSEKHFGFLHS
jgi:hypothetical protein